MSSLPPGLAEPFTSPPLAPDQRDHDMRRSADYDETPTEIFRRVVLGTAWALKPQRIGGLPTLGRMWLAHLVRSGQGLPDPFVAAENPPGLCGFVSDLSPDTLAEAYRRGLHPFAHVGTLKWWSLPERCILAPIESFHIAKRMRRHIRQARYAVTFDRDFGGVMSACAGAREGHWHLTWITPKVMRAYADLFDAGYAHSFEVWNERGELAGGGYGVAVGGAFYTESQFSRESNTSKIGFSVLNWHLSRWGYVLNDGKGATPTILDMGFRMIPRTPFHALLARARMIGGKSGRWEVETDLETVAAWQPQPAYPAKTRSAETVSGEPAR